jgi:hypothetical protein
MKLNSDTKITPHADVVWRLVEGEVVLLNVMSGQYYSLDAVGSSVWTMIPTEGMTLGALRDAALVEFDATPEQVTADLESFMERLLSTDLITIS